MALAGNGVIAIWNDILPEAREDFFEWHPRQHIPERLGIPGFLRGRRCIAVDADVEFLTVYEVSSIDVLTSESYKERLLNPTQWSSSVLPSFRNNVRGACRVKYTKSHAMGGFVLTIRFEPADGMAAQLTEALVQDVMPGLTDRPRITGAHFVVNDVGLTSGNAGVQRGRLITLPDMVLLLEGSSAEGVRAVGDEFLGNARLEKLGAKPGIKRGLYQLEYSLQNLVGATNEAPSAATKLHY